MGLARELSSLPRPNEYVPRREQPVARPKQKTQIMPVGMKLFAACLAVLVASGVGLVVKKAAVDRAERQLQELQRSITRYERENQALRAEAGELASLDRVAAIASTKLGMVQPKQVAAVATGKAVAKGEGAGQVANAPAEDKPIAVAAPAAAEKASLLDQVKGWFAGLRFGGRAEAKTP